MFHLYSKPSGKKTDKQDNHKKIITANSCNTSSKQQEIYRENSNKMQFSIIETGIIPEVNLQR